MEIDEEPGSKSKNKRPFSPVYWFFLILSSLIVAFVLLETGVRLFIPEIIMPDMNRSDPLVDKRVRANLDVVVSLPHIYKYHIRTDQNGFRIPDKPLEKDCTDREVVILGDSFAFGIGVEEKDSFAGLIRSQLPKGQCLLNAAVPGSGLTQQLALYETEIRPMKPDAVILATFSNDLDDCYRVRLYESGEDGIAGFSRYYSDRFGNTTLNDSPTPPDNESGRQTHKSFLETIFLKSRVVRLLEGQKAPDLSGMKPRPLEAWEHIHSMEGKSLFLACFRRLLALTNEDGTKLYVITIPHSDELYTGHNLIRDLLTEACQDSSYILIDPTSALEDANDKDNIWFREGHFNKRGHHAVYDAFLRKAGNSFFLNH